jgi:hypothetical protein
VSAAVEVGGVEIHRDLAGVDWWLDVPAVGATSSGYTLNLAGWVIAGDGEPCDVEARTGGQPLRRVTAQLARPDVGQALPDAPRAGRSGFEMTIDLLRLAPDFAVEIVAVPRCGAPVALGEVRGRRMPLAPGPAGYLQPITITGHGRSGTQWLVRLAGEHPEIVAHRPFELEPRVLVYWLSVLRDVADPASQAELLARTGPDRRFWLGERARPEAVFYSDDAMRAEVGRDSIDELAAFARRRVERFYRAAAEASGSGEPRYFVEKSTSHDPPLLRLQRELFPAAREVVLVRDFRDTFASMLAFNARRRQQGFGRGLVDSDEQHLLLLRDISRSILDDYVSRAGASRLVRYEDLILEPDETLGELLGWLGVDRTPALVAGMRAAASTDTVQMRDHRTSPDVASSIGRWKRDLPPGLRERTCEVFEGLLTSFGYES